MEYIKGGAKMYFGADYYPEHWPVEFWEDHAKLMKEANINVVRIAEFAWAKMEFKEGVFDFLWLDEAIEVLKVKGIKVVLGTPTATPPKWIMDKNPDIYMENEFGQIRGFGSRRHYCYNNPAFKEHTSRIVKGMAEHYKNNPSVILWQIDNEFGCHDTVRCYCDHCLDAFRKWLEKKYTSIDQLNSEWGTIFWSQTYGDWNEVILPKYTTCDSNVSASGEITSKTFTHNPGLLLDFYRFSSDSVVSYQLLQIEVLKDTGCSQPISNNLMGHFDQLNYFDLGKDLDFIVWDNYINTQWGQSDYRSISMAHDLMHGIKEKNFWVMEQQSGPCGWNYLGDTPKPGQIRLWTYQAIAHGAEGMVYFRWRACPFGTEQYWYGILDHDGIPRRRYREIQQIGNEISKLSDLIVGSQKITETAIIKSYDNLWSHEFQPHNAAFNYNKLLSQYYFALASNHINADVVSIETEFSKYKLVFMPAFNLMTGDILKKVEKYVADGGNLVTTFRSGTKNWNNSMTLKTLPGYFKEISGIEVEEFDSLNHGRTVEVKGIIGEGRASLWCDILKPLYAQILATYSEEYYEGEAAITVNSYGKGKVFYVGCDLDADAMNSLIQYIAQTSQVKPLLQIPQEGIEIVRKLKDGKEYMIVLNHTNKIQKVQLERNFTEVLSDKMIHGMCTIEGYGVAVLI